MRRLSLTTTALLLAAALLFGFASPANAQSDTYTGGAITVSHNGSGLTTIGGLNSGDYVGEVTITSASGALIYQGLVPASGVVTVQGTAGAIGQELVTVRGVAADGSAISTSSIKVSTAPAPAPQVIVQPAPAPVVIVQPAPVVVAPVPVAPVVVVQPAPVAPVVVSKVHAAVAAPAKKVEPAKKTATALAVTGSDAGELVAVGSALILLGGFAVAVSRRRRVEV